MTERVNDEIVSEFLCTCERRSRGGYDEWFLSLFIWPLCLLLGEGNGDSL